MRIYIAGKMTGEEDFNRPAFAHAEVALAEAGHEPVNPHVVCAGVEDGDWNQCMRLDIAALMTCDAVCLLDGWPHSRGARLEHSIATSLSMACRPLESFLKQEAT